MCIDGHERADVMTYWEEFLKEWQIMKKIDNRFFWWRYGRRNPSSLGSQASSIEIAQFTTWLTILFEFHHLLLFFSGYVITHAYWKSA